MDYDKSDKTTKKKKLATFIFTVLLKSSCKLK